MAPCSTRFGAPSSKTTWGVLIGLLFHSVACDSEFNRVRIVDSRGTNGTFQTTDVRLKTIEDLREVRGGLGQVWTGAHLDAGINLLVLDDGGRSRGKIIRGATPVRARWHNDGNVAVALDFDTLVMFSAYAHLERAMLYFVDLGVRADALRPVPIFYVPVLSSSDGETLPNSDNAFFFSPADALFLLPNRVLQDIPLSMNVGVMAHEYAHRVFYFEAWNASFLTMLRSNANRVLLHSINLLKAVDEGIADFFGAVIMDDPTFVGHSVPEGSATRDLSAQRRLSRHWLDGRAPTDGAGAYDPYAYGAVLASALWRMAQHAGPDVVATAILDAQRAIAPQLTPHLRYAAGDFEASLLALLPSNHRPHACSILADTHRPLLDEFSHLCP